MPCFRLGAFGGEGMTAKRINGLFSFLAADPRDLHAHALDLLGCACAIVDTTEIETFAAQAPSDAPHLTALLQEPVSTAGELPDLRARFLIAQ